MDVELWKVMTSGNCFSELAENTHPVVLVVGPMGAGKSTNIGIQVGAKYKKYKEWSEEEQMNLDRYAKLQSDERTPQTSDGFTSKTLNIGLYPAQAKYGGFGYLDSAGIDEDRGQDYRIWTRWSLGMAFKVLRQIKCVMLVLDYNSVSSVSRGKNVRDVAKALSTVIGTGSQTELFYKSMIFLFTNAYEGGSQVTVERIQVLAKKQCAEQENKLAALMEKMKAKGQNVTQELQNAQELQEIEDIVAIITLLKTIHQAQGKIHICYPDSPAKSEAQQKIVQKMIERSKPIMKVGLNQIAKLRQTYNSQVLKTLVNLIMIPYDKLGGKSYKDWCRMRSDNLEQLMSLLHEQKDRLRAIDNDWQTVQRDEVDRLGRQKVAIDNQKQLDIAKMHNLEVSTKEVKVDDVEIKKEYPTSGWWSLAMFGGGWGWGKQPAEHTLNFSGTPFSKCKIRKNVISSGDYTIRDVCKNGSSGTLSMHFESERGTNLDLTVDFFAQEKDTQAAKIMVEHLRRQIQEHSRQVEDIEKRMTGFRSADSAQALVDLFMAAKDKFEAVDKDFIEQLDKLVVSKSQDLPHPPSEWAVLTSVFRVLSVLVEKRMLPSDLDDSTRESIEGFVREFIHMKKLEKDLFESAGSKFVNLQRQTTPLTIKEDDAPVQPSVRARAKVSLQSLLAASGDSVEMAWTTFDYIHCNQAAFGISFLIYGFLLRMWPIVNVQDFFGLHSIALAMLMLSKNVFSSGLRNVALAVDGIDRKARSTMDSIRQDLDQKVDKVSDGMKEELGKAFELMSATATECVKVKCSIL